MVSARAVLFGEIPWVGRSLLCSRLVCRRSRAGLLTCPRSACETGWVAFALAITNSSALLSRSFKVEGEGLDAVLFDEVNEGDHLTVGDHLVG